MRDKKSVISRPDVGNTVKNKQFTVICGWQSARIQNDHNLNLIWLITKIKSTEQAPFTYMGAKDTGSVIKMSVTNS